MHLLKCSPLFIICIYLLLRNRDLQSLSRWHQCYCLHYVEFLCSPNLFSFPFDYRNVIRRYSYLRKVNERRFYFKHNITDKFQLQVCFRQVLYLHVYSEADTCWYNVTVLKVYRHILFSTSIYTALLNLYVLSQSFALNIFFYLCSCHCLVFRLSLVKYNLKCKYNLLNYQTISFTYTSQAA